MNHFKTSYLPHRTKLLVFLLVLVYLLSLVYVKWSSSVRHLSLASPLEVVDPAPLMVPRQADSLQSPALPESEVEKKSPRFAFEQGTMPQLAPQALNEEDKYEYYAALSTRLGLSPTGITVIGFRGLAPDGIRHPSSDNASDYDDTFVILKPGRKKVWKLLGSTHAGQSRSSLSPGGVAQIQPGIYQADPSGEFAEMPSWLVTTRSGEERIPCWRDYDADGSIGMWEKELPSKATEILFHNGRYADYGSSIGCQVLPPQLMQRFIGAIGESTSFDYLLIDANLPFIGK